MELLKQIYDLERMASKISYGSITPRGCIGIRDSLKQLPMLKAILSTFK